MSAVKVHKEALSLTSRLAFKNLGVDITPSGIDVLDEYEMYYYGSLNDTDGDHASYNPRTGFGNMVEKVSSAFDVMLEVKKSSFDFRSRVYRVCHWITDCHFHNYMEQHGIFAEAIFEPAGELVSDKTAYGAGRILPNQCPDFEVWKKLLIKSIETFDLRYSNLGRNPVWSLLRKSTRNQFAESIRYTVAAAAALTVNLIRLSMK
jgi:hypothetical protein